MYSDGKNRLKVAMEEKQQMDMDEPDWAFEARLDSHKPNWVDKIPQELWCLGDVFFPIPRRRKGYNYPHHMESYRFSATDEILNAYLEAGSGYGICCAGDLAVVDIDEIGYVDHIVDKLPETLWQKTGSREGYHLFYICEGLSDRINLRIPLSHSHMSFEGKGRAPTKTSRHIGEVKCDPHGYVVGPGSVHPSGNKYGPLKGDEIAEVSKEQLEDALSQYIVETATRTYSPEEKRSWENRGKSEVHDFYGLDADDVLPWLDHGERISHPVHGSSTGMNFMKNDDGSTFTCWRCNLGSGDGCGLSGPQFLAMQELDGDRRKTALDCDVIRAKWSDDEELHFHAWRRAVRRGLVDVMPIPYSVMLGYCSYRGLPDDPDYVSGEGYWTVRNAILYEQSFWDV